MIDPTDVTRRSFFMKAGAALTAAGFTGATSAFSGTRASRGSRRVIGIEPLRIGLIGCGGRGTGAAVNAMEASNDCVVTAMGDLFPDRLASSIAGLRGGSFADRIRVDENTTFVGWDAWEKVIASDVDMVILATPPHFRPMQFSAAIDAGRHVFMEKPVAVDPTGVRMVIEAGKRADEKMLSVVAGTQRRHEKCYLDAMREIESGRLGTVVSAECYWNQGGLWKKDRLPEWSDMEWQLRNWLYFTWLSGDHITEQHVHNLDVCNWAMGSHPAKALGMGGRQRRTGPEYGHIFDHFAVQYTYPDGRTMTSMCRQIDGCASRVEEVIHGSEGTCVLRPGSATISGPNEWWFDGSQTNPYVQEHINLQDSIRSNGGLNEAERIAHSTLTAIMGRMSAYTGKEITWEQALGSDLDLTPPAYEFGDIATPPVPQPGILRGRW